MPSDSSSRFALRSYVACGSALKHADIRTSLRSTMSRRPVHIVPEFSGYDSSSPSSCGQPPTRSPPAASLSASGDLVSDETGRGSPSTYTSSVQIISCCYRHCHRRSHLVGFVTSHIGLVGHGAGSDALVGFDLQETSVSLNNLFPFLELEMLCSVVHKSIHHHSSPAICPSSQHHLRHDPLQNHVSFLWNIWTNPCCCLLFNPIFGMRWCLLRFFLIPSRVLVAFVGTTTLIFPSSPFVYCSRVLAGDLEFCLWSVVDSCWYRVSDFDFSYIHHIEIQMGRHYSVNCRSGAAWLSALQWGW